MVLPKAAWTSEISVLLTHLNTKIQIRGKVLLCNTIVRTFSKLYKVLNNGLFGGQQQTVTGGYCSLQLGPQCGARDGTQDTLYAKPMHQPFETFLLHQSQRLTPSSSWHQICAFIFVEFGLGLQASAEENSSIAFISHLANEAMKPKVFMAFWCLNNSWACEWNADFISCILRLLMLHLVSSSTQQSIPVLDF